MPTSECLGLRTDIVFSIVRGLRFQNHKSAANPIFAYLWLPIKALNMLCLMGAKRGMILHGVPHDRVAADVNRPGFDFVVIPEGLSQGFRQAVPLAIP